MSDDDLRRALDVLADEYRRRTIRRLSVRATGMYPSSSLDELGDELPE